MTEISLSHVLATRRSIRRYSEDAIPQEILNRLLLAGQGITGPDGKRSAPSAHALHPLKLYLAVNRVEGLDTGLYTFDPASGSLTQVHGSDLRGALTNAAIESPQWMMDAACIIIICADMIAPSQAFADQRPYGQRGMRYVYLEAGAVARNIQLQAVAQGLGSVWVGGFDDERTADVLGLQAPLAPIVHICVGHPEVEG